MRTNESPDSRERNRARMEAMEADFEAGCWDVLSRYPVLRELWESEVFNGDRVNQHDGYEIRRVGCGDDVSALGYLLTAERDIESWDVLYRHIRGDGWSPAFPDAGIAIPYTVHGDYIGSVIERANCEAMSEEFPWLVKQSGAFSSAWLEIPLFYTPEEGEEDFGEALRSLVEACGALHGYPLFCEDTDGRIQMEIQENEFDGFISDVSRHLENHHEIGPEDDDEREVLIRARAMEAYQDGSLTHECDSAFTGYFRPRAEEFADTMAEELREEDDG